MKNDAQESREGWRTCKGVIGTLQNFAGSYLLMLPPPRHPPIIVVVVAAAAAAAAVAVAAAVATVAVAVPLWASLCTSLIVYFPRSALVEAVTINLWKRDELGSNAGYQNS